MPSQQFLEKQGAKSVTNVSPPLVTNGDNSGLFDSMFPASPPPEPLPETPHGAIIQTSRTTYRVLDPWTEPLRSGITDPRSDLPGDHLAWIKVLGLAFKKDGNEQDGVYTRLHGARCIGASLERRADRFYVRRGVAGEEDWTAARSALVERESAVVALLTEAK